MRPVSFVLVSVFFFLAGSTEAQNIRVALRPVPPYVMVDPATSKFSGVEYEIITAALAVKGHTIAPEALPLGRLVATFKTGEVDAAAPFLSTTLSEGGTLSDSYLAYHNVALALKETGLNLKKISDLKGLSVVAFQTAPKVLGEDFANAVRGNPGYQEEAQQITQIRLLFSGRVEVVVGDSRILQYFIHSAEVGLDTSKPTQEFPLFPPTNYSVAFKSPALAADFNAGLAAIKANGTYDRILKKYRS